MKTEDIKKQQALSPGPWYLQIGDGSMPYYIMTPLDKTIVAATVFRCDADYIIEMSDKITELEGKNKILESLLESEQTILKLRTAERDKLTIENKNLTDKLEEKDEEIDAQKQYIESLIHSELQMKNNIHITVFEEQKAVIEKQQSE